MYFLPVVWRLYRVARTDTAAIVLVLDGFIWKKKLLNLAFASVLYVMMMRNTMLFVMMMRNVVKNDNI